MSSPWRKLQLALAVAVLACGGVLQSAVDALPIDETVDAKAVSTLKTAATELDKMSSTLAGDDDWVFDFSEHDFFSATPGGVVNANSATFPAATGNGMTMAWINLGPCAMLPPHYHPRASNYVVSVRGTTDAWMLLENGSRLVKTSLDEAKMTIFPTGSLHAMQNTGCEDAVLISALNSEDAGTHDVARGLFSLPSDIVQAAFGNGEALKQMKVMFEGIPAVGSGSAPGSLECRKKCGLS